MKDILIITSYYPPESGAASNRIFQLANGLKNQYYNVSVLTPLPNYPNGEIFEDYKGKFKQCTIEHNINVNRLWIYASNSKNKFLRLVSMVSYSISLIWYFVRNKIPDKVIVQSPPLLVAFTCMLFLKKKKRSLILNVSDLWPLAGYELGALKKNFSYKLLEEIEFFNYNQASLILGQSEQILKHVKSKIPLKETLLFRNYPDFKPPIISEKRPSKGKLKLVYAGLLGVAQGVYKLSQNLDYSYIEFHIYGGGPERFKIEKFVDCNPNLDIYYHGEVSRTKLHDALLKYDLTIIPLINAIYGSVPSKIFEYSRLGLPIIYCAGGEGENIINKYNLGWVSDAGDYIKLNQLIKLLNESHSIDKLAIQKTAINNFNYNYQLKKLISNL